MIIPRPSRPDPARLVAALGIPPRPQVSAKEVLDALADLRQRRIALGLRTESTEPIIEAERAERLQKASDVLDALVAEARAQAFERGELWGSAP